MLSYLIYYINIIVRYFINILVFTPRKSQNNSYLSTIKNIKINSKNQNLIDVIMCYPKQHYNDNKLIIFSHGNTTINEHQQEYLSKLSEKLNIPVIGYDYQGYGNSGGFSCEQNCYEDHESVIKYVKIVHPKSKIYLMARSLGTGIVIDYISKHEWNDPVILVSPYESMLNIISSYSVIRWVFQNYDLFDSKSKIKNITCPIKIFHGKDDSLVDISHAQTLYELLSNKKYKPCWLDGCEHKHILDKLPINELKEVFE
ncbi:alpha/beta hydrolase family protein [Klosneuvirus KNV1]|uniref:Alpha/beta hydrolase family protein n=1 Tax=Klosneuvirus KNV1 TaxID=1977640 RepID=A0A1V0SKK8_9VIRU|nr:alpha/beta hydrolase family protein [Klosneuvirus KNV1]